jgi:prophage regulatory protein
MALPPHLQKYSGLIDLVAEVLAREINEELAAETARRAARAVASCDSVPSADPTSTPTITGPRLLQLPEVCKVTGLGVTSIYGHVKRGLYTPPVKLSVRSSAWPENEVAAINAARVSGKSNDEIRALVLQLVKQREQPLATGTLVVPSVEILG